MNSGDTPTSEAAIAQWYSKPKFAVWGSTPLRFWTHELQLVQRYCHNTDWAILNVGCGAGREAFAFYELGFHGACGVDITPEFIAIAEQRCRELSENIPFCVAAARKLPFPDNHFDLVTLFENIYGHITPKASRLEALAEIRRVLKPNGLVFIEATSIREVFRYWLAIRIMDVLHYFRNPYCLDFGDKLGAGAKQVNMPLAELPRTHWFPPHEIDEEVQTAALEVVQATTVQGFLANPEANAKSYHGKGRLLYVIRKPAA